MSCDSKSLRNSEGKRIFPWRTPQRTPKEYPALHYGPQCQSCHPEVSRNSWLRQSPIHPWCRHSWSWLTNCRSLWMQSDPKSYWGVSPDKILTNYRKDSFVNHQFMLLSIWELHRAAFDFEGIKRRQKSHYRLSQKIIRWTQQ